MPSPSLTALAAAALRVPVPERVLTIGAEFADATLFLAREFPAARVRGVSRDAEAARGAAHRHGLDPEGRVAFKAAEGRRIPYPDDLFDLAVTLDARPAAPELARVLHPPGWLVVVDGAASSPLERVLDRLRGWRLRRAGFQAVETGEAGGGKFRTFRFLADRDGERGD